MKALKRIQSFTILGLFLVFASCSLLIDKEGGGSSVTLKIGSDVYERIHSRAIENEAGENTDNSEKEFSIDVELKGDYTEKKSAMISKDGAQIEFLDIPEGSEVYAEAKIFKESYGRKVAIYSGKTDAITILEGANELTLSLGMQPYLIVTFITDGTNDIEEQLLYLGENVIEPEITPEKDGYTFLGWVLNESDTEFFDFSTPIEENTTLFAKWADNANVVTLNFDTDGGTEIEQQKLSPGEIAQEPEITPEKTGYTFLGWFASESDRDFFDFSTPIVEDTTILAKWVANDNVKVPTSNTADYSFSLSESTTYILRLNGFNYTAGQWASSLYCNLANSDIHATLYVDIGGTNKSIGGNHGGLVIAALNSSVTNSSVDVIFFSTSTGSFEFGRQDSGKPDLQVKDSISTTFSFLNTCTLSNMTFGGTACSTTDDFLAKATGQTSESSGSNHSKFTITKN